MSYASLVNPADIAVESADLDGLTKDLAEAVQQQQGDTATPEPNPDVTQPVADPLAGTKFEGKGLEDVLEAYNNLQSAYGKMSNDLGTQRALTDRLLQSTMAPQPTAEPSAAPAQPSPVKIDSAQLLDDPTKTLDELLAEHNKRTTGVVENRLNKIEAGLREQVFVSQHPDYMQISNDPKFHEFLQADPLRQRAIQAVVNEQDWDTAHLLLTQYKSEQQNSIPTTTTPTTEPSGVSDEARQVALETAATDSSGTGSGKSYSRAALMRLRFERPDVYNDQAFQNEIMAAYRDNRVK